MIKYGVHEIIWKSNSTAVAFGATMQQVQDKYEPKQKW